MYLAIDVGATKTLMALFSEDGKLTNKQKIATNHNYPRFLEDVSAVLQSDDFKKAKISAACCAIPGKVDRRQNVVRALGNLPWHDRHIAFDLEKIIANLPSHHRGIPVYVENDANLAALYEAQNHKKYKKVLYITLSTGIGGGSTIDGKIDPSFVDAEAGHMILEHEGKLKRWEDFASGRALAQRFGQQADKLDNPFAWKKFAQDVAKGLNILLAVLQPDAVIVGGGVGAHLEKFDDFLKDELKKHTNDMVPIPPIIKADRPEEAVIYGCYEYTRQHT